MIECKLCHKFYKSITHSHLRSNHDIAIDEYLSMFPGSILSSEQGKSYEEIHGKEKAKQLRDIHSKSHIGIKQSEETIQKRRESMLGKNSGEKLLRETRVCAAPDCNVTFEVIITSKKKYCCGGHSRLGKTLEEIHGEAAEEIRRKFRESHKGERNPNYKKSRTEETKKKISKTLEGHEVSEGTREKIRGGLLLFHVNGGTSWMSGKTGELCPNWLGGISTLPYPFDFNEELKKLIRERDNNTCQLCDKKQEESGRKLCIHHIDYDKDNCDFSNLISLCRGCHGTTNYNREHWTKVFQQKMELRFCVVS